LLISPLLFSRASEFKRPPYDPGAAKRLLGEAGYPEGFEVELDCPNDRYVNDEAICQAVVAMLARIGINVGLNAQPKAKYFAKVLATGGYDTSFYLLGWTPASFDAWNVWKNLVACRDKGQGQFNLGGYCSHEVDSVAAQVLVEPDKSKRDDLISSMFRLLEQDVSNIPLHQQPISWGVSKKVKAVQEADNAIRFYLFRKD
jgi:peptide/nickel transport system substrate-binding protein